MLGGGGPYTLLRPHRGPGEAYLGATPDGQLCVVQILPPAPAAASREARARLQDAGRELSAAHSPALVRLIDVGTAPEGMFVAREYVPGRDWQEVQGHARERGIAIPPSLQLYVAREAARALSVLGVLYRMDRGLHGHGAVCAANLLCGWDGSVKLADRDLTQLFSAIDERPPLGRLQPPGPNPQTQSPRDDLAAIATLLREGGPPLTAALSSSLQTLLTRLQTPAPAGSGETAEELRQALGRELLRLAPDADGGELGRLLHTLYGEQADSELYEAERWQDAVRRTASRTASGRPRIPTLVPARVTPTHAPSAQPVLAQSTASGSPAASGSPRSDTPTDADDPAAPPDESSGGAAASTPVIDGRYRLLRLIGIGGMGAVYEAQHVSIGKRIAVKILHQQFSKHPDLVERLRREAQAASRIGHPNIVDVIDFGYTDDGSAYLAMEFLEGTDLGAILRSESRVSEGRALRIGLQTVRALAAAHRAGIVHRDLKPENIFLVRPLDAATESQDAMSAAASGPIGADADAERDLVKILDFGVAVHLGAGGAWPGLPPSQIPARMPQVPRGVRLTHPGLAVGTPEYMAPEQALGQEVDARADIYAVGTLLYEMLCGRVPFVAPSSAELLAMKTGQPVPSPRSFAPQISAALESIILRCLARDRGERPQSMEEVERQLVELAYDSGMLSQPYTRISLTHFPPNLAMSQPAASSSSSGAVARAAVSDPTLAGGPHSSAGHSAAPLGSAQSYGPPSLSDDTQAASRRSDGAQTSSPPLRRRRIVTAAAALGALSIISVGFVTARMVSHDRRDALSTPAPAPAAPSQRLAVAPPNAAASSGTALSRSEVAPTARPSTTPGVPSVVSNVGEDRPGLRSQTAAVIEGRVPMLVEWARRAIAGGRYTSPPGDNLIELLQRIEDVAPNHPELLKLRGEAAAAALRRGRDHLRHRQPLDALDSLRALSAIEGGRSGSHGRTSGSGLSRKFPRSELLLQLLYVARTSHRAHGTGLAAAHGAVEVSPRSAAAHLALADALWAVNRRDGATTEYRRVLDLHPRPLERRLAEHGLARMGRGRR